MVNCKWLIVGLFVGMLSACAMSEATAVPSTSSPIQTPTLQPTPTLQVTPSILHPPTETPPPDSGWQPLQSGLERRTIQILDENGRQTEQITLLRIDPNLLTFKIGYSPGQPKSLATWQEETGALIVVNGGFFTPEFVATGLIVIDGQPSGSSYVGFGGMITLSEGEVQVRSLVERPYQPAETFDYALQAFPMLVLNGEVAYQTADFDQARRTAIGVDENGRILLILASWGGFTLAEFSSYLAAADFDLVTALNLDGGTSTGLILAEPPESIPAFVAVPSVITIFSN
ncbi:phosphodiester glycosidase family protein [Candidatus Leptofilum sp.]|uniref:phosphodiester glycosidase family protein n=1 Tax=Candidatus Leptofilum sp. TaxID=3241576 RepID=UPI003B5C3C56